MMIFGGACILMLPILFSGYCIDALSYDYYATTECLEEPGRAHYGGGIVVNHDFNDGIEGWVVFGQGKVKDQISIEGNRFIVAYNRKSPTDGFSQKVELEQRKLYSVSAWVRTSDGSDVVAVVFRSFGGEVDMIQGGRALTRQGCWTLLKGGLVPNTTDSFDLLFQSKNTTVDIWVDNISLQPFTEEQWRSHQDESINKIRKSKVRFQVTDENRSPLQGAQVYIKQTRSGFPFGCGMNHYILENEDYRQWFASRFAFTTFTNEMKWYSTEKEQGIENYTVADAMVAFAKQNNISIRGHNIFWDDPKYQPEWVKSLPPDELKKAADKRITSVVSRYAGELIAWDVVNENLHFSFYEDNLGENASSVYFSKAYELDPNAIMFMNEYNTIEDSGDEVAGPANYLKKLREILSFPGNSAISAGIGVQARFSSGQPNIAYMRASMDMLATAGLPIWLTEVNVDKDPNQAEYLEMILREAYSHPAVEGIITFAGPEVAGFKVMPLADINFQNTPAGDVVDKLLAEWKFRELEVTADSRGEVDVSVFHGDYRVSVQHPLTNSSISLAVSVTKDDPQITIPVQIQS